MENSFNPIAIEAFLILTGGLVPSFVLLGHLVCPMDAISKIRSECYEISDLYYKAQFRLGPF